MRKLILAVLLLVTIQMAAVAKDQGKGKGNGKEKGQANAVKVYRLPDTDVRVVTEYYHGKSLPPGLQKKLARGGTLPPGWQKKIQPVPVVIEQRLAPVPVGYRRGVYDGAFVVYEPARGVIIDVVVSFGR